MPSGSSSTGVTTYTSLPPPKQQKKFSERRRSVKPRRSLPKLKKDQSTLTQIDFVSTPSMNRELITISDSEEEFKEPRPKKKRRKSKFNEREKGQQGTLTQFDRDSVRKTRSPNVDEDGFQIWDDHDPDHFTGEMAERQSDRKRKLPWLDQGEADTEIQAVPPEVPETSQVVAASPKHVDNRVEEEVYANLRSFQTPRKIRTGVIPSSQTPPSTNLSTQTSARHGDAQRSPLKERSTNAGTVISSQGSPESQIPTKKLLERVHLATRKVPLNDMRAQVLPPEDMEPAQEETYEIVKPPTNPPPPRLLRFTTVQYSQSEDLDLSRTPSKESPVRPARTLKRVTTVQDSQYDDDVDVSSDLEVAEAHVLYTSEDPEEGMDERCVDDNDEDTTFDPANSALDRDAARFGWTQTQPQQPMSSDVEEEHADADSETDDEDLDRGVPPLSAPKRIILSSDEPSQIQDEPSSQLIRPAKVHAPTLKLVEPINKFLQHLRPDSRDDSAYESSFEQAHVESQQHDEAIEVPSSPPALHPSQISTVVPTQNSLARPVSRDSNIFPSSQKAITAQAISLTTTSSPSPQKSGAPESVCPETLSSSPLPGPPSSWQDTGPGRRGEESRSLVDYSLPPPPLMSSSSRRGTPMSSAR